MKTSVNDSITPAVVRHVAKLAKLEMTEEQIKLFTKQLNNILDFVNKIKTLDTSSVEPMHQVSGLTNVFRKDIAHPSLSQKEVLSNAPETHNGYFKVKPVMED